MRGKSDIYEENLRLCVETAKAVPEVQRIYLFGSYARGVYRYLKSDLDLFLEVDDLGENNRNVLKIRQMVYNQDGLSIDVDLYITTHSLLEYDQFIDRSEKLFYESARKDCVLVWERQ